MSLNACDVETSAGVTVFYKDPTDSIFKAIGGVTNPPQFAFTHGTGSCNTDDSAENGWQTSYKNGKKEGGSSNLDFNWKSGDVNQDLLYAAFDGTAVSEFRMLWSDTGATQLDFKANVIGWNKNTPNPNDDDNQITKSIAIQLSGMPVWA